MLLENASGFFNEASTLTLRPSLRITTPESMPDHNQTASHAVIAQGRNFLPRRDFVLLNPV